MVLVYCKKIKESIWALNQMKDRHNSQSKFYKALIDEDFEEFAALGISAVNNQEEVDLSDHCFRSIDFRKFDLSELKINFNGCYFNAADLRGQDLSNCSLNTASFHNARVSGVLFPVQMHPSEIDLSIVRGTRVRYKNK
jgi:uncharacterized protein YjbI with pentapeptide repeats